MTFRPETNLKEKNDKESKDAENGNETESAARISTIYNPGQRDTTTSMSFVSVPVHAAAHSDIINKKKTFVEQIKKLTLKLKSKNTDDLNDMQKLKIKTIRLMCLTVLLLCKLILMTAIFVFIFRSAQKPEIKNIIVDGEFQILNRKFEYDMLDKQSSMFNELTFNLTNELNRLFKKSDVGEYFVRSEILEITPNMTVKCIAIFRSSDYINVGRIGLAFLRSLKLQHSHTYLGKLTINVQSIGFQIRGEEGIWGDWSEWNGCDNPTDNVAIRTRKCLTKDTFQETNVDRCLLIPGKKSDLDIMTCVKYRTMIQKKLGALLSKPYNDNIPSILEKVQPDNENVEELI